MRVTDGKPTGPAIKCEGPVQAGALWPACREYRVERWKGDERFRLQDLVIEEAPVAIGYNGHSHVVMLATPLDLEDFVLGFSVTEAVVSKPGDISYIQAYRRKDGIEMWVRIPEENFVRLAGKSRNLTGRTGCGLCGTANLSQALRHPAKVGKGVLVEVGELRNALRQLPERQTLNRLTGAVHGAAWVVPGSGIRLVREDVGRHNALDKLIGALLKLETNFDDGFAIVTSRASYEMVQKCVIAGISFMAAISAPTGLAIRLAEDTGFTLVGFARGSNHVVYANAQRLI